MGKRRTLEDPAAAKRRRVGGGFGAKEPVLREEPVVNDLWGDDSEKVGRPGNKQHGPGKTARIEATTKALRVVRLPDQAQSYNPPEKEHLDAIGVAVKKLKTKERQKKKIADYVKVNPAVKKGCVGDDLTETAWAEELPGEAPEPTKLKDRKTRTQRNKARRMVLALAEKKRRKQRSKIVADAENIDGILKEIESERQASAAKQAKKKDNKISRLLNPRIGRRRFREPVMDLQTTDEVKTSLREQGKVCSSMRDPIKLRFESFQARNIIPAAAPLVSKKARRPAKYFVITERE